MISRLAGSGFLFSLASALQVLMRPNSALTQGLLVSSLSMAAWLKYFLAFYKSASRSVRFDE